MLCRMTMVAFLAGSVVWGAKASTPCPAWFSIPQANVSGIALDETDVYFSHEGFVKRVPKQGGTPRPIANLPGRWVMYLALDTESVYFVARTIADGTDGIYRISKRGGAATLLLKGYASEMVADGDWLYLACPGFGGNGRILRVKTDGTKAETLVWGVRMTMGMVVDGEAVYFSEVDRKGSGVRRVPKDGGKAKSVAEVTGAAMMVQDGTSLYVVRIPEYPGRIDAISKLDGSVRTLVTGIVFETLEPLAFHGDSLYFGNIIDPKRSRIEAVRPPDTARRVVAEFEGGFPRIAVDHCGVYFSTTSGIERAGP